MKRKTIYNPSSVEDLNDRRTIGGNPDGMINFTRCKYEWATKLYDVMLADSWYPQEVSMNDDKKDYLHLTPVEKRLYDLVLSQLIFMDSLQTNNLMDNINPYITAPEINACFARQCFDESLHSKSYAVMVESISDNTDEIYDMWKNDAELLNKNNFISATYENLTGEITNRKVILAMFANQILEGIYFYSGFASMFALGKSGKMQGSAKMIKFIMKDEKNHLLLFQNLINSTRKERPELFDSKLESEVRDMFRKAVDLESSWGEYITQCQILGFTPSMIRQYIESLADERLKAIGYEVEYGTKNPMTWIYDYSSFNDQRSNFFESKSSSYSKGSISFDDF